MAEIAPSLLAADFSNLREELKKIAKANYLHLDIMDGNFVPNISFGSEMIKALRAHSKLKFDTHLMIDKPERYIKEFASAGSDMISFHVEASCHPHRVIQQIKANGCQAGVALNPNTPLSSLDYILDDLDLVLIMTVNPGFGGQEFIPQTLTKIKQVSTIIEHKGLDIKVQVDGGINRNNIQKVVEAGVDIVVAGSAIFKQDNPAKALAELTQKSSLQKKINMI